LLVTAAAILAAGGEAGARQGHRFAPDMLVRIADGQATFRRKLCVIDYRMEKAGNQYRITGHLTFNRRFVPRTPTRVEREILLVDESFSCTRQIDRTVAVTGEPGVFTFHVPDSPTPIPAHLLRAAVSGFELTAPEA
jgi:hypothetical protein